MRSLLVPFGLALLITASAGATHGELFLRTAKNLYCIGNFGDRES